MTTAQDYLQRIDMAKRGFARTLVELGGVPESIAPQMTDWYLDNKLAKIDYNVGQMHVTHGAFLDRELIQRVARQFD